MAHGSDRGCPSSRGGARHASGVGASRRTAIAPKGSWAPGLLRTAHGLLPAWPRSLGVHKGGRRTGARPPSDSEAIIVTPGHAVKRYIVLTADLGALRGAIQWDVCSCPVPWLRAANATSWGRSTMCAPSYFREAIPSRFPYDHHLPYRWR